MTVIPENGTILCEPIVESEQETEQNGIFGKYENFPVYRIISTSGCEWLNPGDSVVCDSTGTRMKTPDGVKYLFKEENIAGKITK